MQRGFDEGYKEGLAIGKAVGKLRGLVRYHSIKSSFPLACYSCFFFFVQLQTCLLQTFFKE